MNLSLASALGVADLFCYAALPTKRGICSLRKVNALLLDERIPYLNRLSSWSPEGVCIAKKLTDSEQVYSKVLRS
jgi:hypothetical protein